VKVQAWIDAAPMAQGETTLVAGRTTRLVLSVPGDGVVRGRVVDSRGRPLGRGDVTWSGDRHVSGDMAEDGTFRLTGVGRGRGRLVANVSIVGITGQVETSVEGVEPDGPDLELVVKPPPRITLRVDGLPDGLPLTIALISRARTSMSKFEPETLQTLSVHPFPGEPTLLVLLGGEHAPVVMDLPPMTDGEERDLGTVRFGPGIAVRCRVVNGSGAPVADVEVAVAEKWSDATTRTDAAGRFHIPRMPSRAFLLRVRGGGFPQHLVTVDPVATPAPEVVVTPGGTVAVHVVDADGRGSASADVTVFPPGEFPYDVDFDKTRRSFAVGAEGKAEVRMCAGPRRLRAHGKGGLESEDAVITVREGETTDVTLVLREKRAK
jgi:hypothetical protein